MPSQSQKKPNSIINALHMTAIGGGDPPSSIWGKDNNGSTGITSKVIAKHNLTEVKARELSGMLTGLQQMRIPQPPSSRKSKRVPSAKGQRRPSVSRPPSSGQGGINQQVGMKKIKSSNPNNERPMSGKRKASASGRSGDGLNRYYSNMNSNP